jgi:hypothetical protein
MVDVSACGRALRDKKKCTPSPPLYLAFRGVSRPEDEVALERQQSYNGEKNIKHEGSFL